MRAFKQEQRIYKSITGFNVKLYYSFSLNNLYFLILDYGCGGSLRQLLQNECYLEEQHAKLYVANLIMAVKSIHRMGIVHRDLKPVSDHPLRTTS
jgi:serine/threonine protein kinase